MKLRSASMVMFCSRTTKRMTSLPDMIPKQLAAVFHRQVTDIVMTHQVHALVDECRRVDCDHLPGHRVRDLRRVGGQPAQYRGARAVRSDSTPASGDPPSDTGNAPIPRSSISWVASCTVLLASMVHKS